ncbi:MAG: acyl-CoA thioesterase [Bacteroidales bacterium]|nr:acyl-CoA thioesterase [Saprospiraceae bacterium]MCF8381578.1 acyl-CoA thioesterase [Bacteroidales bacterium]
MEVLKDFKIKISVEVSWGDMDAMKHLNNVVYLKYFEDSRIAYYDAIGLGHAMDDMTLIGIVKSISCEYLIPISFPDMVEVGAKVISLSDMAFTLEHYVLSKTKGICAYGETEVAIVDSLSLKPAKIPQNIIHAIREIDTF